jgi:CheY-like chemotaxis protein
MSQYMHTILIVDDERDTLTLLRLSLEKEGYQVFVAVSWDEAAERIRDVYSKRLFNNSISG